MGKWLTFYVLTANVDCSLWVSGRSAFVPMNSTHHQNNSSHHMECNTLELGEGQGNLEKIKKEKGHTGEKNSVNVKFELDNGLKLTITTTK